MRRGLLRNLVGCGMVEFGKCLGHVLWHGYVNIVGVIVPVEREAKIAGAGPIFGQVVLGFKCSKEVISISFVEIFDAEVIDSEGEGGATSVMFHRPGVKRTGA